ncbi:hypothetical protein PsAD2_04338 [Pseudovibrio axinellae]|uniref:Uncharacterized protein n=1 Tax=Pseudovibrio axinellae TaxID=989403 RepID=A0A165T4E0_9HYPH|nr:hypothetical protein [Pseudovibrio axinellae]KZL05413.1 hypothetical protein PsAD2_04338 [Pseudovibrio axinellae]SEQ00319.1 hypothetical protein SAMN05421798_101919 [Pseudovibrio axinellae]
MNASKVKSNCYVDDARPVKHNIISLLVFFALTAAVFLAQSLPGKELEQVVVFVSPFSERTRAVQVVAEAGGQLMNTGFWSWIVLANSQNSDFIEKLYTSGAWFVGSGEVFSACFPRPE